MLKSLLGRSQLHCIIRSCTSSRQTSPHAYRKRVRTTVVDVNGEDAPAAGISLRAFKIFNARWRALPPVSGSLSTSSSSSSSRPFGYRFGVRVRSFDRSRSANAAAFPFGVTAIVAALFRALDPPPPPAEAYICSRSSSCSVTFFRRSAAVAAAPRAASVRTACHTCWGDGRQEGTDMDMDRTISL